MTRFSSDILLPFPNLNDLNSHAMKKLNYEWPLICRQFVYLLLTDNIAIGTYHGCTNCLNLKMEPKYLTKSVVQLNPTIAYMKKYQQSNWLRGVQYQPYLYSVFDICTLRLNKKKKYIIQILYRKNRNAFIKNKLIANH